MRRRSLVAVVAAMLASGLSAAWAAPSSVRLELKGAPGTEARFETRVNVAVDVKVPVAEGTELTVSPRLEGRATSIERVISVAENGDLTMGSQIESFDFTLDVADLHAQLAIQGPGGSPPRLIRLPALPIHVVVSKQGKPVAIQGLEGLIPNIPGPNGQSLDLAGLLNRFMAKFAQPLYPDRAVSVGDSWGWKMEVDPAEIVEMIGVPLPPEAKQQMAGMKIPIQTTSRLVGFETVNGIECAKIESDAPWELNTTMPGPKGEKATLRESGTTTVTTWFDYAAGRSVRDLAQFSMEMAAGKAGGPGVNMSMRMTVDSELR